MAIRSSSLRGRSAWTALGESGATGRDRGSPGCRTQPAYPADPVTDDGHPRHAHPTPDRTKHRLRRRSLLIAGGSSTAAVLVAIIILVPLAPGWEKPCKSSFFNWRGLCPNLSGAAWRLSCWTWPDLCMVGAHRPLRLLVLPIAHWPAMSRAIQRSIRSAVVRGRSIPTSSGEFRSCSRCLSDRVRNTGTWFAEALEFTLHLGDSLALGADSTAAYVAEIFRSGIESDPSKPARRRSSHSG